jgi:hypothetical protein
MGRIAAQTVERSIDSNATEVRNGFQRQGRLDSGRPGQLRASPSWKIGCNRTGTNPMLTATLTYSSITRNFSHTLDRTAASKSVTRETDYYLDNIGKVKTVDDLLENSRLYNFVVTAFDLTDMRSAKGLIRKVLEGGITSSTSLANTLRDRRYKTLATAFDFAAKGTETTSTTAARQGTVDRYIEIALETNAGKQNEGARLALYFRRMAPKVTSTTGILADKTLLGIVQTTFGLSKAMSFQPISQQVKLLDRYLSVEDLRDPDKLQKLIHRFTANYDANQTRSSPVISVFGSGSIGLSPSLLSSISNLKLGGF